MEKLQCSFNSVGCTFVGTEDEIARHTETSYGEHLQCVTQFTAEMDLKSLQTYNAIDEIKDGREKLKQDISSLFSEQDVMKESLKSMKKGMKEVKIKSAGLTERVINLERIVQDLPRRDDMEKFQIDVQKLKEGQGSVTERLRRLEQAQGSDGNPPQNALQQVHAYERQVGLQDVKMAEFDLRLQVQETVSYDGMLMWKIKDYARRKNEAINGKTLSLYSQPFYTSRFGYKMCARVYLNGDGMGKGSHMSLFFVVMKGEFDALLPWPFKQRVTMTLVDQEKNETHISDSFRPDSNSSSFRKPQTDMNIASGCPLFASHAVVESRKYLFEDAIFIKFTVDTLGIIPP